MKEQPATVCIVDDDEAVRGSMKLLLKTLGGPALTYGSGQEFLADFDPKRRGCLVLDIRMPGMSGLELQQELNDARRAGADHLHHRTRRRPDGSRGHAARRHGLPAEAVPRSGPAGSDHKALEKDRRRRELLEQSRRSAGPLRRRSHRGNARSLNLIAAGKANKVIAGDLQLSQRTVEIHRAQVMEKMGANSLAHLVRMVFELERIPAGST